MAIDNEELMRKFVRAGMIMRHIDGEGPCGPGPGGPGSLGPHHSGTGCDPATQKDVSACPHHHGPGRGRGHRRGQARVLTMVAMKEGINQKDLAFLLGIRPQTIGEMLLKLEERGFVERRKSERDARAIQVFLTPEGREKAERIAQRRAFVAADMFSALTDEEKEQLNTLLDKLSAELDRHHPGHRSCHHHGCHQNHHQDQSTEHSDSESA